MDKVLLPGTTLELSRVSYGAGVIAGMMVRGAPHEQTEMVARAIELGVNHFDTAYRYGWGRSEVNLSRALEEVGEPHGPHHQGRGRLGGSRVRQRRPGLSAQLRAQPHAPWTREGGHRPPAQRDNFLRRHSTIEDLPHASLDDILGEGGFYETFDELRERARSTTSASVARTTSPVR